MSIVETSNKLDKYFHYQGFTRVLSGADFLKYPDKFLVIQNRQT